MKMSVSAVLWDLDGTLVDSRPDIGACLASAAEAAGLPGEPFKKHLRIGPPIRDIIRGVSPDIAPDRLEAIVRGFRARYDDSDFPHTRPYPGISALLTSLGTIRHFVVTNKPVLPATRLIKQLGWEELFADVYAPNRSGTVQTFTKTQLVALALQEHRLIPENCLFIGDTSADVEAAHANGMRAVCVTWGYTPSGCICMTGADLIAYTADDILLFATGQKSAHL